MVIKKFNAKVSRRALLRGSATGAAALGAMAMVGCGGGGTTPPKTPVPSPTAGAPTQAAASPTAAPAKAAWTRVQLAAAPGARRDHSLTLNVDNGLIYAFGGRANGVANNELWTFDPVTAAWHQVSAAGELPDSRFAHNAFYDRARSRLVVALGEGNGGSFFNDVWAYDGSGWRRLDAASADRPQIRYGAGGAHDVDGNRVLVSHGFTDRGRFDDTWAFALDGGGWTKVATTPAVPIKRCLTRCLWLPASASMLLFGGQTDSNPFLGDLWTLDIAKGAWTETKPALLPGPRNLYGASLGEGGKRWYIVGGNTPDGPSPETWTYDLATAAWSPLDAEGDAPPARYSTDAVYAAGKLYIFGGHDGKSEIDDMWALDPAT